MPVYYISALTFIKAMERWEELQGKLSKCSNMYFSQSTFD